MDPINFEGANVMFAKNQPEYRPLPAIRGEGVEVPVTSIWKPTDEERKQIAEGANIGLSVFTFGGPLQPQLMFVSTAKELPETCGICSYRDQCQYDPDSCNGSIVAVKDDEQKSLTPPGPANPPRSERIRECG